MLFEVVECMRKIEKCRRFLGSGNKMKFLIINVFLFLRSSNGVRNGEEEINSVVRINFISIRSFSFDWDR